MPLPPIGYDQTMRLLRGLAPLASRGSSKLARGIRGRIGAGERMAAWGRGHRDPAHPLLWLHAPSVGEGLQARAVLEATRARRPAAQAIFTHFSPSAEGLAARFPADRSDYLPWDARAELDPIFDALDPTLIAFTKTEVWPGVTAVAVEREVPVLLVAATLPVGSTRLRTPGRIFLSSTFAALTRVLAISEADGARFLRLGVREERIEVTGDPGIDSAWERAHQADPSAPFLAPFHADPRPTLIAGSTWPADEGVLLPGLARVRERHGGLRVVIAPHEPHGEALARLETGLAAAGFRTRRLAEVEAAGTLDGVDAVLVDRVGVLAALYTVGTVAYVGGGFGRAGLHSVLEPAAAGLPTLFGPRYGNAHAAGELLRLGGGVSVGGIESLGRALELWLADAPLRGEAADRARGFIESHRGAAGRTGELLAEYLPSA